MNYEAEAALSFYESVFILDPAKKISIVRHRESNRIFIKKVLHVYNQPIYRQLMERPIANIPHIQEIIQLDEQLVVIEEYISGETLDQLLEPNLSEEKAMDYALQVCRILAELHGQNPPIIHRDIKPENIMIRMDGSVCLLDMNAAKYDDERKGRDTILIGTQGYAAPEQYGFSSSDARTDIFAVGRLINTMLTGDVNTPYQGQYAVRKIINKATAFKPEERYSSMERLIAEIETYLEAIGVTENSSVMSAVGEKGDRDQRRREWLQWMPPGLRSGNIFQSLASIAGYLMLFNILNGVVLEDCTPQQSQIGRIILMITAVVMIVFSGNYRGIRDYSWWPNNRILQFLAIIAVDILLLFIGMIVIVILTGL